MKQKLLDNFEKLFGCSKDAEVYFSPGRVNLIGEHTDYNKGHVFPCALTIGTYAAVKKRQDNKLRFYSLNFEQFGVVETSLDDLIPSKEAGWTNYPKGVIWALSQKGIKLSTGFDMLVFGNIPNGSGLSSSASLEVLTGYALRDLYGFEMTNVELALTGQYSENNFNGMNCGIMDQFASAMGKKDCAIFLDTATLEYEYVPIKLDGMKIVITNSKVKHSLVTSAYNDRRSTCEKALEELQRVVDIDGLGDLSIEEFEKYKETIRDADRIKKARHAVYENQRTIRAVHELNKGNLELFGRLMYESHESLRNDYDVSCREIDVLVDAASEIDGVIGSRITGGGFGGCTVSIVKDETIEKFKEILTSVYKEKFNLIPEFYVVEIGSGPTKI